MTQPAGPNDPASTPLHNLIKDTQTSPINKEADSSTDRGLKLNRRRFLHGIGAVGAGAATLNLAACSDDNDGSWPLNNSPAVSFTHGVASGDPLSDRIILWTRVLPVSKGEEVKVNWQIATDEAMSQIINQGASIAKAANDYTVKVDADKLSPNTRYYYQFEAQGLQSRIGRTKTLPVGTVSQVKMAVFSCANYPAGYFHAYADAARRQDLDVAIHLGDYIYEYGR
ncbi:MAG: PhoD-like phosphatase N-terminal domain-containing protein, partial [Psychrobacter sp.]|nr:PhoD-like phosphatase N-terminal domain-containing protein [Psychrobacter sp.]